MAMGKRTSEQAPLWVPTTDLPVSPGHPFYTRLNRILDFVAFPVAGSIVYNVASSLKVSGDSAVVTPYSFPVPIKREVHEKQPGAGRTDTGKRSGPHVNRVE